MNPRSTALGILGLVFFASGAVALAALTGGPLVGAGAALAWGVLLFVLGIAADG